MTSCIARTALGDLQGVAHLGLVQFRGVPYATPPLGEFRFRSPRPIEAWHGTLDATTHGPIAPQPPSRLRVALGDFSRPQDENCLTLTITTPAPDDQKRPVIVWLHGGGYSSGAGSLDWYDGAPLAREGDVVVVSVNYRLGPLGYLHFDGLGDGQMGLRDMIEAIRWTAAHVGAFGGDPDNITLMGQSAGAHSILLMLTMPDVRSRFRQAILQSAPGVAPYSREQASAWTEQYLRVLDLEHLPKPKRLDRLQTMEPGELLDAAGVLARSTAELGRVEPPFFPVADELADPDTFLQAAAAGAGKSGIAVIVGTNRDEARAIVVGQPRAQAATRREVDAYLRANVGDGSATDDWRRGHDTLIDTLAVAMTETEFARPARFFATDAARAGAAVWVYRLDWAPFGSPFGVCHCLELPLIFGTDAAWAHAPMLNGPSNGARDRVAGLMRATWLSFATHGTPGTGVCWPRYDTDRGHTLIFDETSAAASQPSDAADRVEISDLERTTR